MKKTISNFRTLAALLMAGAAFAACSSSDDIIENQQPANNGKQAYTLTVSASKGSSTTRALTDDDGAIVASWKTTDVIYVTQADGTEIGTLSPTDISGLTATFTGTISGDAQINESDVLTLTYHPIASFSAFASQDGTLSGSENSAENYDMAIATVTISEITGNKIIVSEPSAYFANQTAVVVLKPYNSSWSQYHGLASLTVSVTMNNVPVAGTVTEHFGPFTLSGDQPYYFALPSQASLAKKLAAKYSLAENAVSTLLASATITFTGHQSGDNYDREYLTCDKTGYKFAAGKYYKLDQSNFSMTFLYKRAAAGKEVYVLNANNKWSNTVTYAVNREIGWRIVGDDVYCGDQQLYVEVEPGPLGPDPWEGFVKATDDFIPIQATYSLREPGPDLVSETITIGDETGTYAGTYFTLTATSAAYQSSYGGYYYATVGNGQSVTISSNSDKQIVKVDFDWKARYGTELSVTNGSFTDSGSAKTLQGVNATTTTISGGDTSLPDKLGGVTIYYYE